MDFRRPKNDPHLFSEHGYGLIPKRLDGSFRALSFEYDGLCGPLYPTDLPRIAILFVEVPALSLLFHGIRILISVVTLRRDHSVRRRYQALRIDPLALNYDQ